MKKIIVIIPLALIAAWAFYYSQSPQTESREDYEAFLRSHKYTLDLSKGKPKTKKVKDKDRPDLAFMQDYLRTMDPQLRRPMPEVLREQNVRTARLRDDRSSSARKRSQSTLLEDATVWEERGPSVVGGRTRAMLFDPADPQTKKVWAGGVSGGLWYNDDITTNTSWTKVDDFWDNLSISCITADPNNNQIMYVGTGEAHTSMRGGGIWKTTNGGDSWTVLPSTIEFVHIRDIKIRDESGTSVLYAAVNQDFALDNPPDNAGLYRSDNGGVSWTQVLPIIQFGMPHTPTDIEFGDNEIWVGTKPTYNNTTENSIIYRSTTGTGGWIAEPLSTRGQVELAVAPSNPDVVYVILEDENVVNEILKTTNNGTDWVVLNRPEDIDTGIPAEDFTRGQAWYDLAIAVHPSDPNEVLIGGIDLFRSTDGGTSWNQLSIWHSFFSATLPVVHADQHEILYRPGFPDQAIFGNDGGVYYSSNLEATPAAAFAARNNNYNVTQFYTAALHPQLPDYMLGGTQDNGTQQFTLPGFGLTSEAYGGDGAMCFIDQNNPQIQIVSYVYNDVTLSVNGGQSFTTKILDDANSGNFINVGEYDSNLKILYTAKSETDIYRVKTITTTPSTETIDIPGLGSMVTAMRLSPHVSNTSNLYVGSNAGRVFRIEDAQNATPDITEITGPDFPNGSVSGIAFGVDEDQILVTFFNYGVVSIWETRDGGTTWVDREGDLPNMPVRWVDYHPHNPDQAYIATELGVWSTENINVAAPAWRSTNGGLANVRTDMLRIRKSDGIMMAATHGRGIFTALIPSQLEQTITFDALANKTFGDGPFDLAASATSALNVSFTSSNPAIASIENNTVTIHGAGTITITANQEGNTYYKNADPVPQSLTIAKATQTIFFNDLPEMEINDAPFALEAIADSDLPVSYISSNASVATVAGNVVTIKGVGSTNITARQVGNSNYLAAADVIRELTVVSKIIVLSGDLNFGEVIIGEPESRVLTIQNTGTAPITISGITYPAGFSGVANVVGQEILVTVTFTPTEAQDYTGNIVVTSDATSGVNTRAVSGTGIFITDAEHDIAKTLIVYPNPANDWLTISGSNFQQVKTINLTDESGRVFTEEVTPQSETEMKIKVAGLPGGVYILAIPIGNRLYYKKFSKN